jgi:hypothetical protein
MRDGHHRAAFGWMTPRDLIAAKGHFMNRLQLAHTDAYLAELQEEQTRLIRCLVHEKWITTKAPRDLSAMDLSDQDRTSLESIRAARLEVDAAEAVDPMAIELLKALAGMPNTFTENNPATGAQRAKFECVGCQPTRSPWWALKVAAVVLGLAALIVDVYVIKQRSRARQALQAEAPTEVGAAQNASDASSQ